MDYAELSYLKDLLVMIQHYDKKYERRNAIVLEALAMAVSLRIPAGIRIDPNEPEWPVVFIELPTGQVSWHLPQHPTPYDGHTTEEKYRRVDAFTARG